MKEITGDQNTESGKHIGSPGLEEGGIKGRGLNADLDGDQGAGEILRVERELFPSG